ncbi:MAG: HipA domain-containing protein [Gammaproteobacteria bacterium]|nr:HipA domain-containing protein [Gammaproteobacteria bacterium]
MTSERECFVYIVLPGTTEFVTAARFKMTKTRDGVSIGEFVYGKNYLARPDAVEFDPIELRFGPTEYKTIRMQGFFGAIRDSMPDFWGRRVIERHASRVGFDEFDYLMLGPDDRAGALGFGLNAEPPMPRREFNRTLDLESLQNMADAIINNDVTRFENHADIHQVQELLLEGTSMGGARPKAVIEDNNSLWIAKFSSPQDQWNQPRVELAFLNMAKMCGLQVAESKIISVSGKDVLLVRRFDRDKSDAGYRRYRMVSALTLLKSDDSPTARENWSYLSLADEIRRCSAKPTMDLRELFGRMCFNAIVSNLDDHPRNHAILAKEKNWRLSPAYDLTPTPVFAQDSRFLAMTCGTYGRLARKENLLTCHGRFLLSREDAEFIIDNIVETVRHEWVSCLRRAGVCEKDCITISRAFIYDGFFLPII